MTKTEALIKILGRTGSSTMCNNATGCADVNCRECPFRSPQALNELIDELKAETEGDFA